VALKIAQIKQPVEVFMIDAQPIYRVLIVKIVSKIFSEKISKMTFFS